MVMYYVYITCVGCTEKWRILKRLSVWVTDIVNTGVVMVTTKYSTDSKIMEHKI